MNPEEQTEHEAEMARPSFVVVNGMARCNYCGREGIAIVGSPSGPVMHAHGVSGSRVANPMPCPGGGQQ